MTPDPGQIAVVGSWIATAAGLALWLWSWLRERHPIQKLRFRDCGVVLIFSAIMVRIVAQERPMTMFDWAMVILAPLFIGAALWRLGRTSSPARGG
jgi:hypothetical protein